MANTTEPSVCGGDAVLMSNYFDHLLLLLAPHSTKPVGVKIESKKSDKSPAVAEMGDRLVRGLPPYQVLP